MTLDTVRPTMELERGIDNVKAEFERLKLLIRPPMTNDQYERAILACSYLQNKVNDLLLDLEKGINTCETEQSAS